jgi:pimeloyl-ACP methyl ester carboxylesterase
MLQLWIIFVLFFTAVPVNGAASDGWSFKEMGDPGNAEGKPLALRLLPEGQVFPGNFHCDEKPSSCEFRLTYFLGEGFDLSNKQRRNILYIPGGPGAIVDSKRRSTALQLLEQKHNVVYFHPRGMAQSALDGSKEYDRFLRAGYVVEDIEKLRQAVLQARPWDMIYAHSWGTVIAQRYAATYGAPKDSSPKVMSLVLSAPVDRHRANTHAARARATVDNLKAIFQHYRSQGAATCQCASRSFLKSLVTDFTVPQITVHDSQLEASDNFCFLQAATADKIIKKLEELIPEIDENYGSADFVIDHFSALEKDSGFQKRFGNLPKEFFIALRFLQMSGAPEKDGLVFMADSRNRVNAALLIAHSFTAEEPGRCSLTSGLFSGASPDCEYCKRLKAARQEIGQPVGGGESQRGNYVYGVYDGVARWISVMMGANGCFAAADMGNFAASSSEDKRFGREQARRIGVVAGEMICPWNPADHRHEVPTLFLKGSRDTIVAGCQAEDFFINGSKPGRRVFLEFRGLGHDLSVSNLYEAFEPSNWSKTFAELLEDFAKSSASPARFRANPRVRAKLQKLKARDRSGDPNLRANCSK